jgi:universal stress protein E
VIAAPLRRLGIKVTTSVESDFPAFEAVIRHAKRIRADLIVVDTRAEHVLPSLLRLTDWELLRNSPVPVLMIKSSRRYDRPAILASVDPSHANAKPGRLDAAILQSAAALRASLRGSVHAVHAYYPVPGGAVAADVNPTVAQDLRKLSEQAARQGFRQVLRTSGIAPSRRHLVSTHPVDAIPSVARVIGAAIVVMGAVSRTGLRRIFIGNTAEQVLDRLSCDVMVVKPHAFKSRIPLRARGLHWVAPPGLPI